MVLVLFTTTEAVRSCLGLDESDLPDSTILNQGIKTRFQLDIGSWYTGDYLADWTASGFDPEEEVSDQEIYSSPSVAAMKGMRLSTYSMWFAASAAIDTMLVVTEKTSDGKNEVMRLRKLDMVKIRDIVRANLESSKETILEDVGSVDSTPLGATKAEFSSYNPITGA